MLEKFEFINPKLFHKPDGKYVLQLEIPETDGAKVEKIVHAFSVSKKSMSAEVDWTKASRSVSANSYAWHLITEIANVLRTSKEEVYLQMLKQYGQSYMVEIREEALDAFLKNTKYCDYCGSRLEEETRRHILQVYMGSSEYNTREMSILIDGIQSEARELGISVALPAKVEKQLRSREA